MLSFMNVLIIGNGFDLDLGLPTRYSDFAKSEEWDKLYSTTWSKCPLAKHLKKCANKDNWFDIEVSLEEYAKKKEDKNDFKSALPDKDFFDYLKKAFDEYICSLYYSYKPVGEAEEKKIIEDLNQKSLAANLIRINEEEGIFQSIYSFNYTEYGILPELTQNSTRRLLGVNYVHNMGRNLILGIGENGCDSDEYSFLKKTHHLNYPSTNIIHDLCKADNVVIFGHSLNHIDWPYFKDLFDTSCSDVNRTNKKSITIITKNEDSVRKIKNTLCGFHISLTKLSSVCKFSFIETDYYNQGRYETKEKVNDLYRTIC